MPLLDLFHHISGTLQTGKSLNLWLFKFLLGTCSNQFITHKVHQLALRAIINTIIRCCSQANYLKVLTHGLLDKFDWAFHANIITLVNNDDTLSTSWDLVDSHHIMKSLEAFLLD